MTTVAFRGPPALKKRRAGCPAARDQDICLVLQQSNSVWMMAAPGLPVGLEVCPAVVFAAGRLRRQQADVLRSLLRLPLRLMMLGHSQKSG